MATLDPFSPDFKLSICDGPTLPAGVKPPVTPYTPCDFAGLIAQIQFLINAMIVLGVLAAIVMITYGGTLYLTGVPGKIDQAKRIFKNVGIGFLMMLTAWVIVYQILVWLGASSGFTTLLGTP